MLEVDLVVALVNHIVSTYRDGAVLIFIPGSMDISRLNDAFLSSLLFRNSHKFWLIPLHSMLPTVDQRAIFDPPTHPPVRKIMATNIAETSITIDDVAFIIDCGKQKITNFCVETNVQALLQDQPGERTATQRTRGTHPGWPVLSSIHPVSGETDAMWTGDAIFGPKAMNVPSREGLILALNELHAIGAIDLREDLTILGRLLAHLPLDPHCGKMIILASVLSCLHPILTIGATLDFKDPFVTPLGKEELVDEIRHRFANGSKSDYLAIAIAFHDFEQNLVTYGEREARNFYRQNFLAYNTMQMIRKMKQQLLDHLHKAGFVGSNFIGDGDFNMNSESRKVLLAVICAALYPRIVKEPLETDPTTQVVRQKTGRKHQECNGYLS